MLGGERRKWIKIPETHGSTKFCEILACLDYQPKLGVMCARWMTELPLWEVTCVTKMDLQLSICFPVVLIWLIPIERSVRAYILDISLKTFVWIGIFSYFKVMWYSIYFKSLIFLKSHVFMYFIYTHSICTHTYKGALQNFWKYWKDDCFVADYLKYVHTFSW